MNQAWHVLKFGGTSVSQAAHWQHILKITQTHLDAGARVIIVCSAYTQISNTLEQLIQDAIAGTPEATLEKIKAAHQTLAESLGIDASTLLEAPLQALSSMVEGITLLKEASPRTQAALLAFGELLLTRLGEQFLQSQHLHAHWLDMREHLLTDDNQATDSTSQYLSAKCTIDYDLALDQTLRAIDAPVIITQGFIAANTNGETVLLGRGGSDITAAYLAAKLQAAVCEIWTDVPGIYTANPQHIPQARLLKQLDYEEAQEIAAMGAKVLHPNSIPPVKAANIPLYVKYIKDPEYPGSMISSKRDPKGPQIKSILTQYRVTLITIETLNMWQQSGFLADVFACFKRHHFSIDLVSTSESSVTVSLDNHGQIVNERRVEALLRELNQFSTAKAITPCATVSLVGRCIRSILHQLGPVFEVFENQQIYLLSQSANDLNLSFVVDEDQADRIAKKLHTLLIENNPESYLYSKSWHEEFSGQFVTQTPWWVSDRNALLEIAKAHSPCYLYHQPTLQKAVASLQACHNINQIFFAMKANANPAVLKTFYDAGIGFECVSLGEIQQILRLFPEIDRQRILFTPNFAPREEYERAFQEKVHVTVDSVYPLQQWPDCFALQSILLRIDPGMGMGHHKYVCTGGNASKFGIPQDALPQLATLTKSHNIHVTGLHAHYGSGILQPGVWRETATLLTQFLSLFPEVTTINLGGGLGIVERPGQQPLNLDTFNKDLSEIKAQHPQLQFWLEPGRYLVANAGVILATVTQLKTKGDTHFIGIDTGMNSLIRPSLYGAYHDIVNLSKWDKPASVIANVVGPICESADTLGFSRFLPDTEAGDIILIANTGAYGYVMGSQYNCRAPAKEYFYTP